MVEITGFRALRYAPSCSASLSELVAPPYDVIDALELRRLWERNPHNVVRLILPAGDLPAEERERGYRLAAERLRAWRGQGILEPDAQPSLYLYEQRFRLPNGEAKARRGFFGLARLTEWGEGIHRHELTLPGTVSDRIHLLEACQANLSPIFGLYSDPRQKTIAVLLSQTAGRAPTAEAVDERGVWHGLWQVSDPEAVREVGKRLRERPVVVADGHHRYTAALEYRRRRRLEGQTVDQAAPWDYVLFCLTALEDPGLVILPTHQVLHGLAGFTAERTLARLQSRFQVHSEASLEALLERMAGLAGAPDVVLGAALEGGHCFLLQAPRPGNLGVCEQALDVAVLRRQAVEPLLEEYGVRADLEGHLRYTHEAAEAAAWVSAGEAQLAFLVRATPLEQVRTVALAQRVMPQKSTYFFPKLLSGLVIYDHTVARQATP